MTTRFHLAFGTDASFYRLIPKLVVRVESEAEVIALLAGPRGKRPGDFPRRRHQPVRPGDQRLGADRARRQLERPRDSQRRRADPPAAGVIGANANAVLAPFQRKIGPDPASINAAKIGGIVANNSSGMCCGTAQNTYKTLAGLRVVLDGTVVDSEDAASVAAFRQSHAALLEQLAELGRETRANAELTRRSATSTG